METAKCPQTGNCMYKEVVRICCRILLGHKKNNEILLFATRWMDLEGIMLNEIRWTKKDK